MGWYAFKQINSKAFTNKSNFVSKYTIRSWYAFKQINQTKALQINQISAFNDP